MDQEQKRKVKLIYKELQAYLSQMPLPKDVMDLFYNNSQWEFINEAIDRLNAISEKKYDEFKTIQQHDSDGWAISVTVSAVRSKLGALINILHEEYFSDEPAPFSGSSNTNNTIINNQNSQQQSQQQQMTLTLFEIRDKIDQRLSKTTDEKEKTFLTKLKENLPTITSILQLIQIIFSIAQQSGLDIHSANHIIGTLLA